MAVRHLKFLEMHIFNRHCHLNFDRFAKFHSDRSNSYGEVSVFRFFKMAQSAILDLSYIPGWTIHEKRLAKFGWNRCSNFRIMQVLIFCA